MSRLARRLQLVPFLAAAACVSPPDPDVATAALEVTNDDAPVRAAALLVMNTASEATLRAAGLDDATVASILTHRAGTDQVPATSDDEITSSFAAALARAGAAPDLATKLVAYVQATQPLAPACNPSKPAISVAADATLEIASNTVWDTCTVRLDGTVHVAAGATLTISPGTRITVMPNIAMVDGRPMMVDRTGIRVDGALRALATRTQPIVFAKGLHFDELWNERRQRWSPVAFATWKGIIFSPTAQPSALSYVSFEGGYAAVTASNDLVLSHLDVRAAYNGIIVNRGRVVLEDSWLVGEPRYFTFGDVGSVNDWEAFAVGVRAISDQSLVYIHRTRIEGFPVGVTEDQAQYVELIDSQVVGNRRGFRGRAPEPAFTPPYVCQHDTQPQIEPPPPFDHDAFCAYQSRMGWHNTIGCKCPAIRFTELAGNQWDDLELTGPVQTHILSSHVGDTTLLGNAVFAENTVEASNLEYVNARFVHGTLDLRNNYWSGLATVDKHADFAIPPPQWWQSSCRAIYDSDVRDQPRATAPFVVGPRAPLAPWR